MAGDDLIELKFRLLDGTDIGPNKYVLSTTVESLKENILNIWPADILEALHPEAIQIVLLGAGTEISPKTINDLKLINAGRVLENNRTLAESRVPVGELPESVITMHLVVRPTSTDKNNEKQLVKASKTNRCSCTIL